MAVRPCSQLMHTSKSNMYTENYTSASYFYSYKLLYPLIHYFSQRIETFILSQYNNQDYFYLLT